MKGKIVFLLLEIFLGLMFITIFVLGVLNIINVLACIVIMMNLIVILLSTINIVLKKGIYS